MSRKGSPPRHKSVVPVDPRALGSALEKLPDRSVLDDLEDKSYKSRFDNPAAKNAILRQATGYDGLSPHSGKPIIAAQQPVDFASKVAAGYYSKPATAKTSPKPGNVTAPSASMNPSQKPAVASQAATPSSCKTGEVKFEAPFSPQACSPGLAAFQIPDEVASLAVSLGPGPLLNGLHRAFDREPDAQGDRDSFTFSGDRFLFPSLHPPLPRDPDPDSSSDFGLDAIVREKSSPDIADFDEWFGQFNRDDRRKIVYAQGIRRGLPPAEKDWDDDAKSKKKDSKTSPEFISIVLANGKPVCHYHRETVVTLGDTSRNRFSTRVWIQARPFTRTELKIGVNVTYGATNVEIAQVTIPMDDLTGPPQVQRLNPEELKPYLGLPKDHQLDHGAFLLTLKTENAHTFIDFHRRPLRDLRALRMPHVTALQDHISSCFRRGPTTLSVLVTTSWEDFGDWCIRTGELFAESLNDPRAALKAKSKGQPITVRNYVAAAAATARRIPAQMKFRDVDEAVTVLGDGAAREHAYEKYSVKELSEIQCHAIMMPVGKQKCVIQDKSGREKEVPLLYSFSVVKTSNDGKFLQLAPPLNTTSKIEVEINYRKKAVPVAHKSEGEIVELISKMMHKQLWKHRRPVDADRHSLEQAWANDYAALIRPYVNVEKFKEEEKVKDPEQMANDFAYLLSGKLQKIRASKDEERRGETHKEHHARTTDVVEKYREHLRLPMNTDALVPQCMAVRLAHGEPMSNLSDFQFVAFRPRQPGWPRSDVGVEPAPFLDMREPRLPEHHNMEHLASLFRQGNKRLEEKYLVPIRFCAVDDDVTARSKLQGLLRMHEFRATPLVKWFTTFEGNPITTDLTNIFSVLRRLMHARHYGPAMPFAPEHDNTTHLYPEPLRDQEGNVIEATRRQFQERETIVTQLLLEDLSNLSDDQEKCLHMLTNAPFAQIWIEGVPGSGKTWLAHRILLGCMYSSINEDLVTTRQEVPDGDLLGCESDWDDDSEDYPIKPKITGTNVVPEATEESEQLDPTACYDIPHLAFGPTASQFRYILSTITANTNDFKAFGTQLFTEIHNAYCHNYERMNSNRVDMTQFARVRDQHWSRWISSVMSTLSREPELEFFSEPEPESEAQDNGKRKPATTEDIMQELHGDTRSSPPNLKCHPQTLIIANQNTNGDDSAKLMDTLLNERLGFDERIIRATNVQLARKALKKGFRPERTDDIREVPTMADLVHIGIDQSQLDDFVNRTGEFSPRKHGGTWRLEDAMLRELHEGSRPALFRQLQLLGDPNHVFSKEEMAAMDKNIDELVRDVLADAKLVIGTVVVVQSLIHKKLYAPDIILFEEVSRESELHVRWVQTAIPWAILLCTGDWRQDEPFINGRYTDDDDQKNFHIQQLLTPLSKRIMASRPDCMVFLTENRRSRGGLSEIPSDLFYDGEMRSIHDAREPTTIEHTWHTFAQNLMQSLRGKKTHKDDRYVAEFLTGNRITVLCSSSMTRRGLSPASSVQARLAVEIAAWVHQSHIPGSDGVTRPRICIIAPYTAQVEEILALLRQLSPAEICIGLVEVRTQSAATGGEWDVTIVTFVRDESMGFLSEINRLNVMMTRAKLMSVDIFDRTFYGSPRGHQSRLIRHYSDMQELNGAQITDPRDWNSVCMRCYEPHGEGCKTTLTCFACHEAHHVRNCRKGRRMDTFINPDEINLVPVHVTEADPPGENEGQPGDNAGQPRDDEPAQIGVEQADVTGLRSMPDGMPGRKAKAPAKQLSPDVLSLLNEVLDKGPTLPVREQPDPEREARAAQVYEEDEEEEDEGGGNEDEFADYTTGARSLSSRKRRRRRAPEEKEGVWTKVMKADNDTPENFGDVLNEDWSGVQSTENPDPKVESNTWDNAQPAENNTWDNAEPAENNAWG